MRCEITASSVDVNSFCFLSQVHRETTLPPTTADNVDTVSIVDDFRAGAYAGAGHRRLCGNNGRSPWSRVRVDERREAVVAQSGSAGQCLVPCPPARPTRRNGCAAEDHISVSAPSAVSAAATATAEGALSEGALKSNRPES